MPPPLVGTATPPASDRKALLDGALDALASVNRALADNARDDEAVAAAVARLDAVMCMGPDQDKRMANLGLLDSWFIGQLSGKAEPLVGWLPLPEDGTASDEEDSDFTNVLHPPICPIDPDEVRQIRDRMWLVEYMTFCPARSSAGLLPSRLPSGGQETRQIDGEMKVEP